MCHAMILRGLPLRRHSNGPRQSKPTPSGCSSTSVTDGIEWDTADAAGLGLRPGAAERAAEQLSREEQLELERLLRVEVGGSMGAI